MQQLNRASCLLEFRHGKSVINKILLRMAQVVEINQYHKTVEAFKKQNMKLRDQVGSSTGGEVRSMRNLVRDRMFDAYLKWCEHFGQVAYSQSSGTNI